MRILVATAHRGVVGGIETYLRELLPALLARGHEVALLYEHAAGGPDRVDGPGVPTWQTDDPTALHRAASWRPDVVYLQGLHDPAPEEELLRRFPVVLFAHGYYAACISGRKAYGFLRVQPCGRTFGPACLALYFPCRCGGLSPFTLARGYREQRRRSTLLGQYRAVVVASRHMGEEYRRHGVGAERLHVAPLFPPGVEPDPQPPPSRVPLGRVFLAGRLTDLKGGRFLIEALRQAREQLARPLTLVVAGDGPERPLLEALARRHALPAEFLGWVNAPRLRAVMRQADLLAVPSVWPEPFGLVGVEAGCVGLPAVAYAAGGITDWLRPGVSGELAPADPPTPRGLADALVRALAAPDHWHRLRLGAWETARWFTRERHLVVLEAVLGRAAAGQPPAADPREGPDLRTDLLTPARTLP
jgi:glycosyltransferase involved in cell wall biosynthesis